MATARLEPPPAEIPKKVVVLTLSEAEARSLLRYTANMGDPAGFRLQNPDIYNIDNALRDVGVKP